MITETAPSLPTVAAVTIGNPVAICVHVPLDVSQALTEPPVT
jgi:hypothetical protein